MQRPFKRLFVELANVSLQPSCFNLVRGLFGLVSPATPSSCPILTTMNTKMSTEILPIDPLQVGKFLTSTSKASSIEDWRLEPAHDSQDYQRLARAAKALRESDIPVAFPTETVYGLGADATRSSAVRGIYRAKFRPIDNPLICHFASLKQLRSLLCPSENGAHSPDTTTDDVIPSIYAPLIECFWPGPLTIILPLPKPSPLAPEVSAKLTTFGARIPRNPLALALIHLADRPIAAPSANASTKPSPTAAEHVKDDLDGRIDLIVDGGPCDVGVESTVVDGLSNPPVILRPGGISLEQLRACPGWESCTVGYKDRAESNQDGESNGEGPRAPGMKYRHYSPKAPVVLHEYGAQMPIVEDLCGPGSTEDIKKRRIGVIRTGTWPAGLGYVAWDAEERKYLSFEGATMSHPLNGYTNGTSGLTSETNRAKDSPVPVQPTFGIYTPPKAVSSMLRIPRHLQSQYLQAREVDLGKDIEGVARGLFSALRELDRQNVDVIFVEGIDESKGDVAAAVMNRLRKAAETTKA